MYKAQGGRFSAAMGAAFAGPLFGITVAFFQWYTAPPDVAPTFDSLIFLFGIAIPLVWVVGALIAIVPCLVGSAGMMMLGRYNAGCQLPVMWGLAGAALAAIPTICTDDYGNPLQLALIATGAACALICRTGARWDVLCQAEPALITPAIRAMARPDPTEHPPLQRKGFLH